MPVKPSQVYAPRVKGCLLYTSYAVLQHLDGERYLPVPIGITRQGQWMRYEGGIEKIPRDTWLQDPLCKPVVVLPGHETGALLEWGPAGPSQIAVDVALPIDVYKRQGQDRGGGDERLSPRKGDPH